jgi:hypothetical protein
VITGPRAEKCLHVIAWVVGPLCLPPFGIRAPHHREKEREGEGEGEGEPNKGGQLDIDQKSNKIERKLECRRKKPFRSTRKGLMGALRTKLHRLKK